MRAKRVFYTFLHFGMPFHRDQTSFNITIVRIRTQSDKKTKQNQNETRWRPVLNEWEQNKAFFLFQVRSRGTKGFNVPPNFCILHQNFLKSDMQKCRRSVHPAFWPKFRHWVLFWKNKNKICKYWLLIFSFELIDC